MENKNKIIYIEGLSASGKTTLRNILAKKLNGVPFHPSQNNPFEIFRKYIYHLPALLKYFYYLIFFTYAHLIIKILSNTKIIITDRSFLATLAELISEGLPNSFVKLTPKFLFHHHAINIYLDLNEKDRIKKISQRKKITKGDKYSISHGIRISKIYAQILPRNTFMIAIDNKTPGSISKEVLKKIQPSLLSLPSNAFKVLSASSKPPSSSAN